MAKKKVAVLFGGVSSEYEVSLRSAATVLRAIDREKYTVIPIGVTKRGRWLYFPGEISSIENDTWHRQPDCVPAVISPDRVSGGIIRFSESGEAMFERPDVIFPVMHGRYVEDGCLQGLLEMSGVPYVGCGVTASALCMDKAFANALMDYYSIPHCEWTSFSVHDMENIDSIASEFEKKSGYPMIVKPSCAGSSVGVSKVHSREELRSAVLKAFAQDSKVVLERCVVGREIECAVIGNEKPRASLHAGEILPPEGELYSYDEKYSAASATGLAIPAALDAAVEAELRATAVKAYRVFGCAGLARVDFFVEGSRVLLNELNTLPGFTSISMYPKLMEDSGVNITELVTELIELAESADDRNI